MGYSNNENYANWRAIHTSVFGEIFSSAFEGNDEAQIHLTAALINISKRSFGDAIAKLSILKEICTNENDCAAVAYFMGLSYEMLGDEKNMSECYEKLAESSAKPTFPIAFHPYYRTAKLAQKNAECAKATFYYQKALEFYDGTAPDMDSRTSVSQIMYDFATLYLFTHQYDECKRFLELSKVYDPDNNQQRTYVETVLLAVFGKADECRFLLSEIDPLLKAKCEPLVKAILCGEDLHYCVVKKSRTKHIDFWKHLLKNKTQLEKLIEEKRAAEAQQAISDALSETFPFMNRELECRVEDSSDRVTVYCKSYCAKTLIAEYEALFSKKPQELGNWNFVSVQGLEFY